MKPAVKSLLSSKVPTPVFLATCLLLASLVFGTKLLTDRVISMTEVAEETLSAPSLEVSYSVPAVEVDKPAVE